MSGERDDSANGAHLSPTVEATPGPGLNRRQVVVGAAAGTTLAVAGPVGRALAAPRLAVTGVGRLSFAFLAGSDEVEAPKAMANAIFGLGPTPPGGEAPEYPFRVVAADSLIGGDTELANRGLTISVLGLFPRRIWGESERAELPLAVDVDLLFPPADPLSPKKSRYAAWSFRRARGWNPSPPVRCFFPIDWEDLPEFELAVQWPRAQKSERLAARFTFDDEPGRPRLLRGIYLAALTGGAFTGIDAPLSDYLDAASARWGSVLVTVDHATSKTG